MAQDNNSSNKEMMIRWLGEVIHREVSKPDGEANMELVKECEETLLYLSDCVPYSEEELIEKARLIISGNARPIDTYRKSRTGFIRRAAVIAACVVLFIFGSVVTVYAFVPSFQSYIKQVIGLQNGSTIDADGITFEYLGDSRKYDSIADLLISEDLDGVLLPNHLPDEMRISIINFMQTDDHTLVSIKFIDENVSMEVEAMTDFGIDLSEISVIAEKTEVNNVVSYVSEFEGIYRSVSVHEGYIYYITADTKSKIIALLEGLF